MRRRAVHVVGGGPAGLALALALDRRGERAVVHESGKGPGIDKACGEGLMPDGVECLRRWGVEAEGRPFRGIVWRDAAPGSSRGGGADAVADAVADFPAGPGLGIRRTRLHRALADAAHRVADVRYGERVRLVDPGSASSPARIEVGGETIETAVLVAADGLRSKLRAEIGLGGAAPRRRRFGVRRHVEREPWGERVEVWWGEGVEAYVTPVGEREVGIAFLWGGRKAGFDVLLEEFPGLGQRIEGARVLSRDRGTGPLEQPVRGVRRGRTVLLGDAAGYLDAITGEGLALAFRGADALADLLAEDRLDRWPAVHRRLVRLPTLLIRLLLLAEGRPFLRRRLLAATRRDPGLFAELLRVHVGERGLGAGLVLRLLGRLALPV